jgi:hypothetical protein
VTVGRLPGRRPPAGPALRRVEEVVTSRSDQRIDRPLLPELPLSGRQVSGCLWLGGHQHGHVVAPAAAAADMATVRPDTDPEPLPPQATAAAKAWSVSGRLGHAHSPCGTSAARPQARSDTSAAPSGMPSRFRTPADTLPLWCYRRVLWLRETGRRSGGRW